MSYQVDIKEAASRSIIAVSGNATMKNIGTRAMELFTQLHSEFEKQGIQASGNEVLLYHDHNGDSLLRTEQGVFLDAGVETAAEAEVELVQEIDSKEALHHVQTPAGMVAWTTHIGPYSTLTDAHCAIRSWCVENRYQIEGTNWDIYTNSGADPASLVTIVEYSLL